MRIKVTESALQILQGRLFRRILGPGTFGTQKKSEKLTSLDTNDVDPILTRGDKRPSPPINKYFSEFFSPRKTRTRKSRNLNLDRKIFSSLKIKKEFVCGIRTHDLAHINLKLLSTTPQEVVQVNAWRFFDSYDKKN